MTMETTIINQTYALAALFQVAQCVNELAHHGRAPADDMETLINSIFIDDAPSTIAIYENTSKLIQGFTVLSKQLNADSRSADMNIARIVITLIVLERKLTKNTTLLAQVYSGIERAKQQSQHFESVMHANVLSNLASLYADTVSTIFPKVIVMGEEHHLSNTDIVNRVRSLLLAGIRAAVLFRQVGGRRWHLIFRRKKYIQAAEYTLKHLDFTHTA